MKVWEGGGVLSFPLTKIKQTRNWKLPELWKKSKSGNNIGTLTTRGTHKQDDIDINIESWHTLKRNLKSIIGTWDNLYILCEANARICTTGMESPQWCTPYTTLLFQPHPPSLPYPSLPPTYCPTHYHYTTSPTTLLRPLSTTPPLPHMSTTLLSHHNTLFWPYHQYHDAAPSILCRLLYKWLF